MKFDLYDALVPNWLQTLGAVSGLIDKAQEYADANKLRDNALIEAKLAPDMLPFGFQVKSVVTHSIGAVEGVRKGLMVPDRSPWPQTLAELKAHVLQAREQLVWIKPEEINGFFGRDMCFAVNERELLFTAENFLLSFSVPNFYFHATTAYAVLRNQGLPLTKLDFLGSTRKKT